MIKTVLTISLGTFLFAAGCSQGPTAAPPPVARASVPRTGNFQTMLNAERARAGLPGVVASSKLATTAQAHASDMSAKNYFSHTSANGRTLGKRAKAQGYNYCWIAENIALGQGSEAEVLTSWMTSAGHRKNNLASRATEFGLGRTSDNYWVLVLGQPGC